MIPTWMRIKIVLIIERYWRGLRARRHFSRTSVFEREPYRMKKKKNKQQISWVIARNCKVSAPLFKELLDRPGSIDVMRNILIRFKNNSNGRPTRNRLEQKVTCYIVFGSNMLYILCWIYTVINITVRISNFRNMQ